MKFTRAKRVTRKRRAVLEAFMNRPGHPEGTLSYREVRGFIFTVACTPEMIMPSQWLPEIFGGDEPNFSSSTVAETIIGVLMDLYNENVPRDGKTAQLPRDCRFHDDLMSNLEPEAPVSQWCRGFVLGHTWLIDCWDDVLPDGWGEDLAHTSMTLSFFSSRELAEEFVRESTKPELPLEEMAEVMRRIFPAAIDGYSHMGHTLFKAARDMRAEHEEPTTPPPPGRNDPCTCGSGRKYKKCCGAPMN